MIKKLRRAGAQASPTATTPLKYKTFLLYNLLPAFVFLFLLIDIFLVV